MFRLPKIPKWHDYATFPTTIPDIVLSPQRFLPHKLRVSSGTLNCEACKVFMVMADPVAPSTLLVYKLVTLMAGYIVV